MRQNILKFWAKNEKWCAVGLLVIALLYPVIFPNGYLVNVAIMSSIYIMLSLSTNFITGYMGILNMGQAAFFGIGAYTAAIFATRLHFNFIFTFLFAMVVSAIFGILLGLPTLRLSGRYLSVVTMAFCEICRTLEINLKWLTRGPMGITAIPAPSLFGFSFDTKNKAAQFYFAIALVLLIIFCIVSITNSRIGRAINAIKDNEIAASAMGINPFYYKVMTFSVASVIAGTAGAFYAHYIGFIDPSSFSFDQSSLILSMTVIGGLGNVWGSILGAIALISLPEILRPLMEVRQILYGIVLVLMMLFRPQGVLGGFNLKHIRQRERHAKKMEEGARYV